MKNCVVCRTEMRGVDYIIQHTLISPDTGQETHLPVCEGCFNGAKKVFYCHKCKSGYKSPTASWGEGLTTCTVVVCRKCSLARKAPIVECDVDGCDRRLKPSGYITGRNRQYCPGCWEALVGCGADYCRASINRGDRASVIVRQNPTTGRMVTFCKECTIPHLPEWFPVPHPVAWDYKPKCWCRACDLLRGMDERWPKARRQIGDRIPCGRCHWEVPLKDLLGVAGMQLCHLCTHGKITTCPECRNSVLYSMVHPVPTKRKAKERGQIPPGGVGALFAEDVVNFDGTIPDPGGIVYQQQPRTRTRAATLKRPPPSAKKPHPDAVCDDCVRARGGFWLCNVVCNRWWFNGDKCNCDGVHPYTYTPPFFTFNIAETERFDPKFTPYLGFELEIECLVKGTSRRSGSDIVRQLAPYAYSVHDGTLADRGKRGFEIVSHPFTYLWFQENWDHIKALLLRLKTKGYRSWEGGRCGMHIHVSRKPMSDGHQKKFMDFLYGSQNLSMCVGQRGPRSEALQEYAPFDKEPRAYFLEEKIRKNSNPGVNGHYAALNANKPTTLEARWFRGTLHPDSFRKNIEFIHAAWMFTKKFGFASANEINFIGWLRGIPESKDYPTILDFLERQYVTRR